MGTKKGPVHAEKPPPPLEPKKVPNVFSRSLFCWMVPIFYYGNKRDLEEYDLVPTKSLYNSKVVGDKLER